MAEGTDFDAQTSGDGTSHSRTSRVKGQISEFAQTAKTQASAAIQPLTNNARTLAEEQKTRGAGRIGNVAQAFHSAADEMAQESPLAANYVHAAAKKLDETASLLRDNSVEELVQIAADFAEERPLVFIGGAVAAGFALSRLLRSSTLDDESGEE
jgi:ElaB/YqjD/DUF883 family membrane-anchored ribosome-binding protein